MNIRRPVAGCAAGVLTVALGVGCLGGGDERQFQVTVTGLPDDVAASIGVTGPKGYAETLTGTIDLGEVSPGTYSFEIAPVRVSATDTAPEIGPGTWHPATEALTVDVDADETAQAVIDYTTLVPDTTKTVEAEDSGLVRSAEGATTLAFHRDAEVVDSLQPGDVLVGGIGSMTPHGLLRRVMAVRPDGDVIEVDTRPASLPEAAPIGAFHIQAPLSLPSGVVRGAALGSGPLTGKITLGNREGMCKGPGELSANLDVGLDSPQLDFQSTWRDGQRDVRLQLTFPESATITVKGGGSVTCTGEKSFPATPLRLPAIPVPGLPGVVVTPQLDFPGTLSASVKAGMTFTVKQRASLTIGGEYIDGQPRPIADFSNDFDVSATPTGEYTTSLKGGVRIRLLIDETVGPSFTLSAGVSGTIDPVTPKYELKGGLYGTVSMDVTLFGIKDLASVTWPDVIKHEEVLWSVGSPTDPNTGGGGGGGDGGGSGGSPCPSLDEIQSAPGYLVPPDTMVNPLADCYGGYALTSATGVAGGVYAVLLRLDRLGWTAAVGTGDACDLAMMKQAPLDVRQHYGCAASGDACGVVYDRAWESEATVAVTAGGTSCAEAMRIMRQYLRSTESVDRYFRTAVMGWSCWDQGAQHPTDLVCENGSAEIAVINWSRD